MEEIGKQMHQYLLQRCGSILSELEELIRIPSVRGAAEDGAPFGRACADVLEHIRDLYRSYGFTADLDSDGGYLLSYYGDGPKTLGLFAHADVVPTGDDWILTQPFEPRETEGCLVGRGALDDKSAVIISLYAARMIRDLQLPFHARLVMFTGSAEETGMDDLRNYLCRHTPPDFALVPDTAFPLYRGNKGRIVMQASRNKPLGEIKQFKGGKPGTNIGEAYASLPYREEIFSCLKTSATDRLTVAHIDDEIRIHAEGLARHTALPDGSINAAALIADALRGCSLLSDETRDISDFLYGVCSDYKGGYPGIACPDPEFGPLTFVNYQIDADDSSAALYFNIRFGAAVRADDIIQKLTEYFGAHDFSVRISDVSQPHIVPHDHPMLRCVKNTYEAFTQTKNAPMYVNAGGTYGQLLPCAAEIGTTLRWGRPADLPEGHGAVHQPDECIRIDGLLEAIELTTLMLFSCEREQEEQ
ncbi:MAG: Sapep family Mn(2+)-dependent dipeptidase [Eubacteriales bacterium]